MTHIRYRSFTTFSIYADFLALNFSHWATYAYGGGYYGTHNDLITYMILTNICWPIAACATGLYAITGITDLKKMIGSVVRAVLGLLILQLVFIKNTGAGYLPAFVLWDGLYFCILLGCGRLAAYITVKLKQQHDLFKQNIVIIGNDEFATEVARNLKESDTSYIIKGLFSNSLLRQTRGYPVLGRIADCISYAINHSVTEIYSTISPKENKDIRLIAEAAEKHFIRFRFIPDLRRYLPRDAHIEDYIDEAMPIVSLRTEPLASLSGRIIKRAFDIVFSIIVIVFLLSWLVPLIGLLIKLTSPGPVFFMQLRTGKYNKPFYCYKFRSLKVNDAADSRQVTRNDDRYTSIGKFLRKTNLDELPQFFNVLLGQMSVVGARPHMLKHTEDFSRLHPEYMIRHFIKPGITGWAQVNGYRGEITANEQLIKRVEHDLWYLEHWSLWLDIRIICRTATSMFGTCENAY